MSGVTIGVTPATKYPGRSLYMSRCCYAKDGGLRARPAEMLFKTLQTISPAR